MNRMNTPWGVADSVFFYDPERTIVHVSTPRHGGIGVALTRPMPQPLAAMALLEGGEFRWFEEDQDWSAVPAAFPQYFSETTKASAKETLKHCYPHVYEQIYNERLTAADSRALAREEWEAKTRDKYVVTSGFGSWAWNVPEGYVYAAGYRRSDETTAGFLVPAAEYDVDPGRLVLDGYPRWTPDRTLPYSKPQRTTQEAAR